MPLTISNQLACCFFGTYKRTSFGKNKLVHEFKDVNALVAIVKCLIAKLESENEQPNRRVKKPN